MFKKILVSEDFESYNLGISKTLTELKIPVIDQVYYCDDALLRIRKALFENNPYDLLITDLSFVSDYRNQKITNGEELIHTLKREYSKLKIIVFSVENRFYKIKSIIDKYNINGFVTKGRDDSKELKRAIQAAYNGEIYISNNCKPINKNVHEFTPYDVYLLRLLSQGFTQKNVEEKMKKEKITPNSESSIEKRLAVLRESLDAKDTKHLISIVLEMGII